MCENGRRKKIGGKKNTNTKKTQRSWKQGNNTWCGYWLRFYLEHKKIPGKICILEYFPAYVHKFGKNYFLNKKSISCFQKSVQMATDCNR